MVDKITTNPQRSEPIADKDGVSTDQTIEWFDDIELALNENLLGEVVQFRSYTVAQLETIVPPATTPQFPASNFLNGVVIVSDDAIGQTLATSNGTNWIRVYDGQTVST